MGKDRRKEKVEEDDSLGKKADKYGKKGDGKVDTTQKQDKSWTHQTVRHILVQKQVCARAHVSVHTPGRAQLRSAHGTRCCGYALSACSSACDCAERGDQNQRGNPRRQDLFQRGRLQLLGRQGGRAWPARR